MARRLARSLWFDDDLALHAFVAAATELATKKRIPPRLGGLDIHRDGFAFLQFKAVFAKYERQARRRVGLCAIWKRVDVQAVSAVGGNNLQANLVADFQVDHRGIEDEILGGHGDNARRRLGSALRLRFRGLIVLLRAGEALQATRRSEYKQRGGRQ